MKTLFQDLKYARRFYKIKGETLHWNGSMTILTLDYEETTNIRVINEFLLEETLFYVVIELPNPVLPEYVNSVAHLIQYRLASFVQCGYDGAFQLNFARQAIVL